MKLAVFVIGSVLVLGMTHQPCQARREISICGLPNDSPKSRNRMTGSTTVQLVTYPWYARLTSIDHDHDGHITICGGSMITSRHVLTAAHCFDGLPLDFPKETFFTVAVDLQNTCRWSPLNVFTTTKVDVHEKYDGDASHGYDIALLTLNESHYGNMPVCLPHKYSPIDYGYEVTIAGFGLTQFEDKDGLCEMNEATVDILTKAQCMKKVTPKRAAAHEIFDKNLAFCAGYLTGVKGVCAGESGGSVLVQRDIRYVLKGIISYIRNDTDAENTCGDENALSMLTNVAAFIDWIDDRIDVSRIKVDLIDIDSDDPDTNNKFMTLFNKIITTILQVLT